MLSGYMTHPCKGHGEGFLWLLLLKPNTGGDYRVTSDMIFTDCKAYNLVTDVSANSVTSISAENVITTTTITTTHETVTTTNEEAITTATITLATRITTRGGPPPAPPPFDVNQAIPNMISK